MQLTYDDEALQSPYITFGSEVSFDPAESDGTTHQISIDILDTTPSGDHTIVLQTIYKRSIDTDQIIDEVYFTLKVTNGQETTEESDDEDNIEVSENGGFVDQE